MKKLLILLIGCLILGTVAAEAQIGNAIIIDPIKPEKKKKEKKPRPEYGFEQSVDLSFNLGQSQFTFVGDHISYDTYTLKPKATIMANWIGGRRFNKNFFIGGGAGVGYARAVQISYYSSKQTNYSSSTTRSRDAMMINIFPHLRYFLGKKQLQPFVALSLGCSFDVFRDWVDFADRAAFMINPEVGLNYRMKDHLSFYFNLGYAHAFTDGVQLKLGVTF